MDTLRDDTYNIAEAVDQWPRISQVSLDMVNMDRAQRKSYLEGIINLHQIFDRVGRGNANNTARLLENKKELQQLEEEIREGEQPKGAYADDNGHNNKGDPSNSPSEDKELTAAMGRLAAPHTARNKDRAQRMEYVKSTIWMHQLLDRLGQGDESNTADLRQKQKELQQLEADIGEGEQPERASVDNGHNNKASSSTSLPDDTGTMELTAAVGSIISLHTAGNNVDENSHNRNRSSSDSLSQDMEYTDAVGRIISLHTASNGDSRLDNENIAGSNTYGDTDFIVNDGQNPSTSADVSGTGQEDPPLSAPPPVERYSGRHSETGAPRPSPADRFPGLITPEQANKAAGRPEGVITHCRVVGELIHVMVRYGPEHGPKYIHSTRAKADLNFDIDTRDRFGRFYRLGDLEEKNRMPTGDINAERVVGPYNFSGILAVCYKGPLKGLRPKWEKMRNGKKRKERRKFPITEVYVLWFLKDKDGKDLKGGKRGTYKRVWETRGSLDRAFASDRERDEDIYNAAKIYDKKYREWLAKEKAPKKGRKAPVKHKGEDEGGGRGRDQDNDEVEDKYEDNDEDEDDDEDEDEGEEEEDEDEDGNAQLEKMRKFKDHWCKMNKVDPQNLNPENQRDYLYAWDMRGYSGIV